MKYAIVEHSGKQYLAEEGGRIEVDRLPLEAGKPVEFKEVLLVTDGKVTEVGSPYVSGATVKGKVLEHDKAKKITVFKYKPKQRYRRTRGHRQNFTRISIEAVGLSGSEAESGDKTETKDSKSGAAAKPARKTATKKSGEKAKSESKAKAKSASGGKKTDAKAKSESKKSGSSGKSSKK